MKFKATVIPSGNATAVEVPRAALDSLEAGARPLIAVTINGHRWRTRVAAMRGLSLVGVSAANRKASGIAEGDLVEVELELDVEPRIVDAPADVAAALDQHPALRPAFEDLPFGLRRKLIATIEEARAPETRARRIAKLVEELAERAD